MANIKHAVVRTDNLGGTKNGEQLASVIFYSSDAPAAMITVISLFWARSWVVRLIRQLLPQLVP